MLPNTGALEFLQIRNEFHGQTNPFSTYSSSNSDLFNLNYYRGKWYYRSSDTLFYQFSTGSLSFSNFRGVSARGPGSGGGDGGQGDGSGDADGGAGE